MLKPQVELVHCTDYAETLITEMARVSAPKNKRNWETGPKLIKYLIKNKHWSPFEMASMCVSIHTTRAISSQILRHRSFSFQEFSQRYADAGVKPEEKPKAEATKQETKPEEKPQAEATKQETKPEEKPQAEAKPEENSDKKD